MTSKKLIDMLNKALSMELQASIQYMMNHVMVYGIYSESIADVFKKTGIEEMKHAESISERIDYVGGEPTTKPAPITLGKTAEQSLNLAVKAEEDAIAAYRDIVKAAEAEADYTTRELIEDILAQEEDHHNTFTTLLQK
jgi:bacterioferritin